MNKNIGTHLKLTSNLLLNNNNNNRGLCEQWTFYKEADLREDDDDGNAVRNSDGNEQEELSEGFFF